MSEPDTRKLWIVSVELEALVLAESAEEARTIADTHDALRDDLSNRWHDEFDVSRATYLPSSYGENELVYHGGTGDITVKQAMEIDPTMTNKGAEMLKRLSDARAIAGKDGVAE